MRNSSVKHCHPGRAYLEVEGVGAGESSLWKQAVHADGKEAHTGPPLKAGAAPPRLKPRN